MSNAVTKTMMLGVVAMIALMTGMASTRAAQPTIPTPAGIGVLPNVIYVIPYAVSTRAPATGGLAAETIVSINSKPSAAGAALCNFQVEWVDFAGLTVGFSGGPGIPTAPLNGTFEYTTLDGPPPVVFPFIQNVFSNVKDPFEGYARIRTDCAVTLTTGVDAEFVIFDTAGSLRYRQIEPIRPTGNVGE